MWRTNKVNWRQKKMLFTLRFKKLNNGRRWIEFWSNHGTEFHFAFIDWSWRWNRNAFHVWSIFFDKCHHVEVLRSKRILLTCRLICGMHQWWETSNIFHQIGAYNSFIIFDLWILKIVIWSHLIFTRQPHLRERKG